MQLEQPEEPIETRKLTKKQKQSLYQQLKNVIAEETNIIIAAAAVFVLVITPFIVKTFPTNGLQGANISLSPSPTATVTPQSY